MSFNFKAPVIKTYVLPKARFRLKGERTLTHADKEKEKKRRGYKCDNCGKTFWKMAKLNHMSPSECLEVHHKREVFKSKSKAMVELPRLEITTARKTAYMDRPENLEVFCKFCHTGTHKQKSRENKKKKKRRNSSPFGNLGI